MKYHLDSNAWISTFNNPELYAELTEAYFSRNLEIEVTNQVRDELTDDTKIKNKDLIAKNQALLGPFIKDLELDSIFILGVSRFGEARLAGEDISSLYRHHLDAKSMNLNNIRDGIHLANARYAEATLVTCDRQLQASATSFEVLCMCLGKFCELQNWGNRYRCSGCL